MRLWLTHFARQEAGQTLTEYVLLLAFILFAVIGLTAGLRDHVSTVASVNNSNLEAAKEAIR